MEANEPTIVIEEARLAETYTRVPNTVLRDPDLSPGAKLAYAMLLSYAWHEASVFPGQARLAVDMGVTERSVIRYLQELQDRAWIRIRRRGLGLTNVYVLVEWAGRGRSDKLSSPEVTSVSHPEVTGRSHPEVTNCQPKKTKLKTNEGEERDRFTRGRYGHVVRSRPDD
jgi:DNA-binding transcriptional MocR family regulator